MKTILHLLLGLALCGCAMAQQTAPVRKIISGNGLTENLNVPSGKTLTIESGATINAAAGSTITGFGSGSGLTNFASTLTGGTLTFAGTLTTGRTLTWRDLAGTVALTSDLTSYQPLDSDLTAIAALTTATFGRSLLEGADAAAVRTLLALGTAAQMNATASEGSGSQVSLASHTHSLGGSYITGTLPITKGGTGLVDTPTNGQLLIGNTATNAWARATLTGGNGITITNGNASISIAVNLGTLSGTVPVANGGTGITSFGSGVATWLGTPSSSNLRSALTDETGTGAAVFGTSPTITTPTISGNFTGSGTFSLPGPLTVTGGGNAIVVTGNIATDAISCYPYIAVNYPTASLTLSSGTGVNWTSGDFLASADVGLARVSSGVLKVSDGSTGHGRLEASSFKQSSGPTWTSGSGSPEGVETAPVGSFYSRTGGGAGTTLYVKESGSGNTGWVAK